MSDLISRQAAVDAIETTDWYHQNANGDMASGASNEHEAWYKAEDVYKALNDLPSAQPRKKGKWVWKDREVNRYRKETGTTEYGEVITIMVHDNYLQKINYCPVCGKRGYDTFMNYCPSCGAKMDGFEVE